MELLGTGTTSFTLGFTVRGPAGTVATGETAYVVVATDGSGKKPIPDRLRRALGPVGGPAADAATGSPGSTP